MDFIKGMFIVSVLKVVCEKIEFDIIVVIVCLCYGQLILVDFDVGGLLIMVIIDLGVQNSVGNLVF